MKKKGRQEVLRLKKLSTDNWFFDCMGNIGDWIILNILFLVTSIPVVTIGMSLTAMYKVTLRRVRGESVYVAREYFAACKEEWKNGSKIWIGLLLTGALLLFDLIYAPQMGTVINVLIGMLLAIWSCLYSYAFPMAARFENTVKNTLLNSFVLAVRNLLYTIVIVALNAIPVICIVIGPFATMMAMPIYLLVGFSLTARINSIFFTRIFATFMNQTKSEEESNI